MSASILNRYSDHIVVDVKKDCFIAVTVNLVLDGVVLHHSWMIGKRCEYFLSDIAKYRVLYCPDSTGGVDGC